MERSEVESEEGDQPTQINTTVKSALPVENNRSEVIVPEFSVAVQTRAQVKREVQSIRPLKVTMVDKLNITPDEFKKCRKKMRNYKVVGKKLEVNQQSKG